MDMQLDIKAVYLNAPLDKQLYITIRPSDKKILTRILIT
jgi:hypothetical protein